MIEPIPMRERTEVCGSQLLHRRPAIYRITAPFSFYILYHERDWSFNTYFGMNWPAGRTESEIAQVVNGEFLIFPDGFMRPEKHVVVFQIHLKS